MDRVITIATPGLVGLVAGIQIPNPFSKIIIIVCGIIIGACITLINHLVDYENPTV